MRVLAMMATIAALSLADASIAQPELHPPGEGGFLLSVSNAEESNSVSATMTVIGLLSVGASATGFDGYGTDLFVAKMELRPLGGSSRLRQLPLLLLGVKSTEANTDPFYGVGIGTSWAPIQHGQVFGRASISRVKDRDESEVFKSLEGGMQFGDLSGLSVMLGLEREMGPDDSIWVVKIGLVLSSGD